MSHQWSRYLMIATLIIIARNCSNSDKLVCKAALGKPDDDYTELFQRDGGGWTGGDGTYSIALPDGRNVWLFGDSFLGTVNPDGSRPNMPFIRNAMLVQNGLDMTTFFNGTSENPSAPFTPANPEKWYWPGDGTVIGNKLYLFMTLTEQVEEGMWGFHYAGQDDVAVLSLPDLTLEKLVTVNEDDRIIDGVAILELGDYLYIYGSEDLQHIKYAHVARVPADNLFGTWEYFDGQSWTTDPAQSARLLSGVSNQYSVIQYEDKYLLVTQVSNGRGKIMVYEAPTPTGPFKHGRVVYCTPEMGQGNLFTYNAVAHPQFSENGDLLISYNVNSHDFQELFVNADNYRPRFIRIPLG